MLVMPTHARPTSALLTHTLPPNMAALTAFRLVAGGTAVPAGIAPCELLLHEHLAGCHKVKGRLAQVDAN